MYFSTVLAGGQGKRKRMVKARAGVWLMLVGLVVGVVVGGRRGCLPWTHERRQPHSLPDCLEWYGYDDVCDMV